MNRGPLHLNIALAISTLCVGGCGQSASYRADRTGLNTGSHMPADAASPQATPDQQRAESELLAKNPWPDRRAGSGEPGHVEEPLVTTFRDELEFSTATGGEALVLDFDRFHAGDSLGGRHFNGMTIVGVAAEPLVVEAAATWTPRSRSVPDSQHYQLVSPYGARVLSPGGERLAFGPDPSTEDDDLVLTFDEPVSAVAFMLLTPSADGLSFTEVSVYSVDGQSLFKGQVDMVRSDCARGASYPAPGAAFWGCTARDAIIARIEIDEQDSDEDCPDSNIGFGDIRFIPPSPIRDGDLDGDRFVDTRDLEIFGWLWESSDAHAHAWLDLNGDGSIDDRDRAVMSVAIGEQAEARNAATVPPAPGWR